MNTFLETYSWASVLIDNSSISAFESFYKIVDFILNRFFPETTLLQNPNLPSVFDPHLNAQLKKRSKLLNKGRFTEANQITVEVGKAISAYNSNYLSPNRISGVADLWNSVNKITGKGASSRAIPDGVLFTTEAPILITLTSPLTLPTKSRHSWKAHCQRETHEI